MKVFFKLRVLVGVAVAPADGGAPTSAVLEHQRIAASVG